MSKEIVDFREKYGEEPLWDQQSVWRYAGLSDLGDLPNTISETHTQDIFIVWYDTGELYLLCLMGPISLF